MINIKVLSYELSGKESDIDDHDEFSLPLTNFAQILEYIKYI
jgi:hypothetical protein